MKIYRLCSKKYSYDLTGLGAALHGGRWNPKGMHMLYTSESISLALLENLVHLNPIHFPELDLLTLEIPDQYIDELDEKDLPKNWKQYPAPNALAQLGKAWILSQSNVAWKVPSVIVSQSYNYLLNPLHPKMKTVELLSTEDFVFDRRLYNNVFGTVR